MFPADMICPKADAHNLFFRIINTLIKIHFYSQALLTVYVVLLAMNSQFILFSDEKISGDLLQKETKICVMSKIILCRRNLAFFSFCLAILL